ncbi:hypothetical protein NL676_033241 [Syzygium grande]|nr:hypothetical protein NL676_033241 [Syzygium grande]
MEITWGRQISTASALSSERAVTPLRLFRLHEVARPSDGTRGNAMLTVEWNGMLSTKKPRRAERLERRQGHDGRRRGRGGGVASTGDKRVGFRSWGRTRRSSIGGKWGTGGADLGVGREPNSGSIPRGSGIGGRGFARGGRI